MVSVLKSEVSFALAPPGSRDRAIAPRNVVISCTVRTTFCDAMIYILFAKVETPVSYTQKTTQNKANQPSIMLIWP